MIDSDMQEINRVCNKCAREKAIDDFPKQSNCRNGRRPTCKVCMAKKTAAWRTADPERAKASQRSVKERNPERWYEKERARAKKYKDSNREKVREAYRRYSTENPHVAREYYLSNRENIIKRSADWAKKNPEKARILSLVCANRRRAAKVKATPAWADSAAIKWFYEMRNVICDSTGMSWHVDHIIPLKNKHVCGLHVEWNLQIIQASDNLSKSNKFETGQPDVY